MSIKNVGGLTVGCVVFALAATGVAGEWRLDDAALDKVVAGAAETGISIDSRTGADADNFARAGAGLSYSGFKFGDQNWLGTTTESGNAGAQVTCQAPCSSAGTLAAGALDNDVPVRDNLGFPILTPDGEAYGAYAVSDGGFRRLDAVAFGPTGSAETTAEVVPAIRTNTVSATFGFGVGKTTGDGESTISGNVLQGQGVGNGFAIKSPTGNTILLGVAIAVDPSGIRNDIAALVAGPL